MQPPLLHVVDFQKPDAQLRDGPLRADAVLLQALQWKVGDVGKVLYDSARPTDAVWLGRETDRSP